MRNIFAGSHIEHHWRRSTRRISLWCKALLVLHLVVWVEEWGPHIGCREKKVWWGSYGDGHHITESTHSWSFLEVLKSPQGLAKKLLGVSFTFFVFGSILFCFSDLGDDAFLGSAVLYSKEFRDEPGSSRGLMTHCCVCPTFGKEGSFWNGFGFERMFFLEGCAGINIRLGRKTLQKEVWKMLSWMIHQSWSLAGLCSFVLPEPSVPGSTGGSKAAWEPLASLQTHYVRVTSVSSFMWPDCKQPVRSISSSSNTTAALLKIFFDDASPQRPDAQHFFSQLLIVGSCTTNFITAISSDLTYLNKFQEFLEILRHITAWRRL